MKEHIQNAVFKFHQQNFDVEWFKTKTGVRQGDPLSSLLFSVVLDSVITNLEIRGNITTKLKQICAYANDIIIIGKNKTNLN